MTDTTTMPVITLDEPIRRGEQTLTEVRLRKPKAGELRGTQLVNLLHMDIAALEIVLPRITVPTLTKHEVGQLDPADITQFGSELASFLLTKEKREGFP